jgi:F-type H+-transporting ATPase subunit gamma
MTETAETLRRRMAGARELQSVVRTMKTMAAGNVSRYEQAVRSLNEYSRTVRRGLGICLHEGYGKDLRPESARAGSHVTGSVVFGSDQGLVGRFNELVAELASSDRENSGDEPPVWAVGERMTEHLRNLGLSPAGTFNVPAGVEGISPLVGRILHDCESRLGPDGIAGLQLFFCRRRTDGGLEPVCKRLIPPGRGWLRELADRPWPMKTLPEVLGDGDTAFKALIREYLFVSLFRACAESMASENAGRLSAMQRAERNIEDMLGDLHSRFHRMRQSRIDEELFDVVSGFEALSGGHPPI